MIFHVPHVVAKRRSSGGQSFLKRGASNTSYRSAASVFLLVQLLEFPSFGIGNTVLPSETESLSMLSRNAPAVTRAIVADPMLRSVVGSEKWPQALKRLAEFSKSTNTDCREALRIIGDAMPRVKSRVGKIQLDGVASEWGGTIPPAAFVLPNREAAKDLWGQGAAAVVRQDRLYLMIGLANAAQYFG
ncbi:MAG: hypothetical protein NTY53_17755, partial [Kiritimatiellaeota bacterium]|nr:hypothetical protein [Kiritimatiellota bacterium]